MGPGLPEVRLRPFGPGDEARLLDWVHGEEEVTLWAGRRFHDPLDLAQLIEYRRQGERPASGRRIYAVVEGTRVVGHVEVANLDAISGTAVLARVLVAPAERGRGVGEAMLREVVRTAFERLLVDQLLLRVYAHNEPAVGLYRRLGFRRVELAPEVVRVGQRRWEVHTMRLSVEDWRRGQTTTRAEL